MAFVDKYGAFPNRNEERKRNSLSPDRGQCHPSKYSLSLSVCRSPSLRLSVPDRCSFHLSPSLHLAGISGISLSGAALPSPSVYHSGSDELSVTLHTHPQPLLFCESCLGRWWWSVPWVSWLGPQGLQAESLGSCQVSQ